MQTFPIVRAAAHIHRGSGLRRFVLDPICKEAVSHNRFNRTFTTAANLVGGHCCPWHAFPMLPSCSPHCDRSDQARCWQQRFSHVA